MKHRTDYSMLVGNLRERMLAWLEPLFGRSLSEDYYGGPLKNKIMLGVYHEFGNDADVSFPDNRSVRLRVGKHVAILVP